MECGCPVCTQRIFGATSNRAIQEAYEVPINVEAPKSAYEQLDRVIAVLGEYHKDSSELIEEVEDIQDLISSIDDEVVKLQQDCIKKPIDHTQFRLGELSKKLY